MGEGEAGSQLGIGSGIPGETSPEGGRRMGKRSWGWTGCEGALQPLVFGYCPNINNQYRLCYLICYLASEDIES